MQLTFLILVLCCYIQNSTTNSPPQGTTWRRSRYIIDNRRNALFSKKPSSVFLQDPSKESPVHRFGQDGFKQTLFPSERYHKDLAAEASISEPKFYRKYGDNSLPRKIIKSYQITGGFDNTPDGYNSGIFETQKNTSRVLDPQDYIQNENDVDVGSKIVVTTTQKPWESASTSKDLQKDDIQRTNPDFEFGIPTTASYPWEIAKGNQIDNTNEKHVYETRIETVSYHQEVIFNPPKKQDWYEESPEPKNYEQPEENYEEPEKNYEQDERNYEEPEKNYEQDERNYEEPEKNYEQDERNYEEPEKNYEESEKNYELDEGANVMPDGRLPEAEDNQNKFGYVVEGSNYRKYRVEERTVDGFIVGEYGVVSHDDGSLRGVRYTADGNTNPKLIYETLIKFLSL